MAPISALDFPAAIQRNTSISGGKPVGRQPFGGGGAVLLAQQQQQPVALPPATDDQAGRLAAGDERLAVLAAVDAESPLDECCRQFEIPFRHREVTRQLFKSAGRGVDHAVGGIQDDDPQAIFTQGRLEVALKLLVIGKFLETQAGLDDVWADEIEEPPVPFRERTLASGKTETQHKLILHLYAETDLVFDAGALKNLPIDLELMEGAHIHKIGDF